MGDRSDFGTLSPCWSRRAAYTVTVTFPPAGLLMDTLYEVPRGLVPLCLTTGAGSRA